MADLANSQRGSEKKLDISAGDMVSFVGDCVLKAGVGIVLSANLSRIDIYDAKGEDSFVHVFWVEKGKAMWMRSKEIAPLVIEKGI